jgi:chemotaxis protein MotA
MRKSFEASTIVGLVLGVACIFGSFGLEGGKVGALVLLPAMLIVFGGTVAAATIGSSMGSIASIGKLVMLTVRPPRYDVKGTIETIVQYSTTARKEGLLALERELDDVPDRFMKKSLRLVIDGIDPENLRALSETEMRYVTDRHAKGAALFQRMGGYSPTMGIIGTVMGLIATLAAAGEDPNELIRHIASAFIATLWGVFMANLVWLPIADKLRSIHEEEHLYMDMILEGVLGIQGGEVPSVIRAKLNSMLPSETQDSVRI